MIIGRKRLSVSLVYPLGLALLAGIAVVATSNARTPAGPQGSSAVDADTVAVVLTESALQAPDTLYAGPVDLEIQNKGSKKLGFAIKRKGGESGAAKTLEAVAPGASASLSVKLEPGTYVLSALTDGERNPKLLKTVTVVARERDM